MKELFQYIRRKLSIKVSLWVVLFAAIIFVVALGFLFVQSRDAVRKEAINHATQILDKTSLRVEGILNRVEVATNMTTWLAQQHSDKPDSIGACCRTTPTSTTALSPSNRIISRNGAGISRRMPKSTVTASKPYRVATTATNISIWNGI